MITAKFSNGTTDAYKGTRPVKAAWAIIRKSDGKTLASGHSLDAIKAAKTADSNFRFVARAAGSTAPSFDRPHNKGTGECHRYWAGLAKKAGHASWKAAYAAYQADLAAARANVSIEVIAL